VTGERFAGNEQRMTVTADPLEQVNAHSLLSAAKWRWSWDCTPRAKSDIYDCIVTFLIFFISLERLYTQCKSSNISETVQDRAQLQ